MTALKQEIATLLADNDTGAIAPGDVRYLFTRLLERGPNQAPSLWKSVRFMTRAESAADPYGGEAFEDIDFSTCCMYTSIWVDSYRTTLTGPIEQGGVLLRAAYDGSAGAKYQVQRTAGFLDADLVPAKWVRVDSPAAAAANIPLYVAGTTYPQGFTIRAAFGGVDAFFYALKAGQLPAPGPAGDSNWKKMPSPVAATALSQLMTLAEAQAINHDQVVAGRLYLLDFGPDQAGYTQTISLLGVSDNSFSIRGILEANGQQTGVRVNVDSGVFGEEASYNTLIVTDVSAPKRAAVVSAVANNLTNGSLASALDSAALAPSDGLSALEYVAREFIDLAGGAGYLYKCYLDSNGQVVWFRFKVQ